LTKGYGSAGSGIELEKQHPDWSAGKIALYVEGGQGVYPASIYERYEAEATKIVEQISGDETDASTGSEAYKFERQKNENSYAAAVRLATDVNWRFFLIKNTAYYCRDIDLFTQRPVLSLPINHPGIVGDSGYELLYGKTIGEVDITLLEANLPDPSTLIARVIELDETWGPAAGLYLVSKIEDTGDGKLNFTLTVPMRDKPEPANESSGGDSSSSDDSGGTVRDKILRIAKSTMSDKDKNGDGGTGYYYYLMGGTYQRGVLMPKSPNRSDCSSWAQAVYLKAGAPDPGATTYEMLKKGRETSNPKPGDLMLTPDHVEIYVGEENAPSGFNTIGHGSKPIDYGSTSSFSGHVFRTYVDD